jgi:diacylglycerol kinase (ATP)
MPFAVENGRRFDGKRGVPAEGRIMKICVILNPNAGAAEGGVELRRAAEGRAGVEVWETKANGDGARLASKAVREGFEVVAAAGGDGTIHEVVNGLVWARSRRVRLGVVPMGTGNDLARTLGAPLDDPAGAFELLFQGAEREIDLMRVRAGGREVYGANVAAGGFTGQMNEAMTDELKDRWGPLAYLRGAVKVLPDLTRYRTRIRFDGKAWEDVQAMNIVIANGRTAGGGMVVAPTADIADGLLDVVIVKGGGAMDLAGAAARLLASGSYLNSEVVEHRQAKRVEVHAEPGMMFNVDGEVVGDQGIVVSVEHKRMKVVGGIG